MYAQKSTYTQMLQYTNTREVCNAYLKNCSVYIQCLIYIFFAKHSPVNISISINMYMLLHEADHKIRYGK